MERRRPSPVSRYAPATISTSAASSRRSIAGCTASGVVPAADGERLERRQALDREQRRQASGVAAGAGRSHPRVRDGAAPTGLGTDRDAELARPAGGASPRPGRARLEVWIVPANTSPEPPSIVSVSPFAIDRPASSMPSGATRSPGAPTTAGIPQPRATTAAWLAIPPRGREDPGRPVRSRGRPRATSRLGRGSRCLPRRLVARPRPGWSRSPRRRRRARPASPTAIGRADDSRRVRSTGGGSSSAATRRTAAARVSGKSGSSAMSTAIREGGLGAALADPDLEQPQAPRLDGELDVAQVGEVALQELGVGGELRARRRAVAPRGPRSAPCAWAPATTSSPWAPNSTSP